MVATCHDKQAAPQDLSTRDEKLLDMLIAGKSERAVAEAFGISQARVNQIRHTPAAVAYLLRNGGDTKAMLFSRVGAEILARMDWGGVKMADLIAIWKAAMPQEMTVKFDPAEIEAAATRLAERTGIPKDRAIIDIRERLNRKAG